MVVSNQKVDLLISHSQIQVRSRPYDESASQWGRKNLEQGAVLHSDYVVFDPLPDDAFGANVKLYLLESFSLDELSQRCIVVPFNVTDLEYVELASATEKAKITLSLEQRQYSLYFEVCEGDEIFYKLTFVPSVTRADAEFLIDDPWGGVKSRRLVQGVA